ncbi:energy-coupling factor transporter transmembrane protein EcfT [Nocardiopsis gilva YIM 90087]|uniref:Energy-coupling factor transporter transmembrane protein EcfT n=1 Tax=Nocardiopsis gilva YIM 90087 TaxID=1235441 RepID=A0A223SAQ1_9ACTN|nr:energy-coupling factor transporter transmembrane component T [Nocardiopsis gilva]ASU85218.1 energy-coupling factor transporter transmembrane protein EcfT [Nocardiopsis gilva YIM 90087]
MTTHPTEPHAPHTRATSSPPSVAPHEPTALPRDEPAPPPAGERAARPAARAWLRRANPAAKVVAALMVTAALIPTVDPVTPGVVLAAIALLLPFAGIPRRTAVTLGGPLLLAAFSVGVVNLVFGEDGPLTAFGLAVRLLAIALPGVLVAATSEPTELTDALVQRLKVPERPAMGVLAALRLIPLLADQWRTLTLARRARGLEAGRNPLTAATIFTGKAFALLVRSIRTGTLLATAMDARAFGTGPRTRARESVWRRSDTWLLVTTAALLVAAHALSLSLGTWKPLFM